MKTPELYSAKVSDWADSNEFVVLDPHDNGDYERLGTFDVPSGTLFVIVVAATPNDLTPAFLDVRLRVTRPKADPYAGQPDTKDLFVSERMVIVHNPPVGTWSVDAADGRVPYAVHAMAFHPLNPPRSIPTPGPTGGSSFKCRACKATSKGLAVAVVAAATLPVVPHALLGAAATYLGVKGTIVAGAFVQSVIGSTVSDAAEALCKKVSLC